MARKSYKKTHRRSAKKSSSSRRSSSRRSSSRRSSSRRSSSKGSRVRAHYRTLKKTRVKAHYRMRGMGHLLSMYGGAAAELEEAHKQCLEQYKEMIQKHAEASTAVNDLKANGADKSSINVAIRNANDIRNKIVELVDAADGCKAKQKALLDNINQVTSGAADHLDEQIAQSGGSAAEMGAKLDAFGQKASAAAKQAGQKLSAGIKAAGEKAKEYGQKLSAGMKSLGDSMKKTYNDYKDKKALQKKITDLSYCEKTFSKDELTSGTMQSGGGFFDAMKDAYSAGKNRMAADSKKKAFDHCVSSFTKDELSTGSISV